MSKALGVWLCYLLLIFQYYNKNKKQEKMISTSF